MAILNHIQNLIQISESLIGALKAGADDVAKMAVGGLKAGKYAALGTGLYQGGKLISHMANSAPQAAEAATTHLASKPTGTANAVHQAKAAAVQHKAAVAHKVKAAATQHKAAASSSMKKDLQDISDKYAAKKAAINADEVKNQTALKAKHAAVNSKLETQKSLAKLPSQQAYKARFDSSARGNGPVPTQWYKDRPGNQG